MLLEDTRALEETSWISLIENLLGGGRTNHMVSRDFNGLVITNGSIYSTLWN